MIHLNDIYKYINELAPFNAQMDFDNSGLLIGNGFSEVHNPILALDITSEVINNAISLNSNLIITHHPVIFHPLNSILETDDKGKLIGDLIKNGISVISAHTNADLAEYSVSDCLIDLFNCSNSFGLEEEAGGIYLGRIGELQTAMSFSEFMPLVCAKLNTGGLKYYNAGLSVKKIGFIGGAGSSSIPTARKKGCDTMVTSEIKHHEYLQAKELGINVIDAGHFATENPYMYYLKDKLESKFEITFTLSECNYDITGYFVKGDKNER